MYCPSCGAELPPNARFCSECGLAFEKAPAKPVEQPAPTIAPRRSPPAERSPINITSPSATTIQASRPARSRQKASKIFISALLVVALVGAVFSVVIVLTWGSIGGHMSFSYDPAVPPSADTWSFDVAVSSLDIRYTTNASAPEVRVDVYYDIKGGFLAGKTFTDLNSVMYDNSSEVKEFSLKSKSWWSFPMIQNIMVIATLKSGIMYNISASASIGRVQVHIPDNENLTALSAVSSTGDTAVVLGKNVTVTGPIRVHASTGSASITIDDGCVINGRLDVSASTGSASIVAGKGELAVGLSVDVSTGAVNLVLNRTRLDNDMVIHSSTGDATVSLKNITLSANVDLNVSVSTGSIRVTVDQTTSPGGNITASMTTSTGSVYISYKSDDDFASAKFTTSTSSGSTFFTNTGGFTKISNTEFQSVNQLNLNRFDAQVSTSTGSVYITGQMV
ncbi:MAG: zinc-ribbon domain-containing protein [Candidatus Sigynarchaeota archaeon]